MKVLILNGSPRPDGDTAYLLGMLKDRFPQGTAFEEVRTFEADIRPCDDCRYCWEHEGCCISDRMDALLKEDYDVLVIASPLYMSFVTPPLFSAISRLNAIWSNRFFLGRTHTVKPRKGILVLAGGGDGSPGPAISVAQTAFRLLNVRFDPEKDCVFSLHTNDLPVRRDTGAAEQADRAVGHVCG